MTTAYQVDNEDVDVGTHRFSRVHNTADRPVFNLCTWLGPDDNARYHMQSLAHVVPAERQESFLVPIAQYSIEPLPPSRPVAVELWDVEQTTRIYDLEAETLHRRRKRRVQHARNWLYIQRRFVSEFGWKAFNLRSRRRVAPHKKPDWRK
ncbi:hypothetical protein ABZ759_08150 [Streptomyces sp. NPDC047860]|uniref:hypothetical protein n=1 Tax=Streptomyces sp. NPDC047860 TaxID=3155743 RepID=UPI0033C28226